MPMLDVSIALTNPYTMDKFNVMRRAVATNNYGEPTITPTTTNNVNGVVHPGRPNDLKRLPEAQIMSKTIVVITRFALRGATKDGTPQEWEPDVVVWNGDNYLVITTDDYSQFARGFVYAICSSMDTMDAPAETN